MHRWVLFYFVSLFTPYQRVGGDFSQKCSVRNGVIQVGCPCKAKDYSGLYMMKDGQLTCDMCDAGERWNPDRERCENCSGSRTSCKKNIFPGACNKESCAKDNQREMTSAIVFVYSPTNTTTSGHATVSYATTGVANGTQTTGNGNQIQAGEPFSTPANTTLSGHPTVGYATTEVVGVTQTTGNGNDTPAVESCFTILLPIFITVIVIIIIVLALFCRYYKKSPCHQTTGSPDKDVESGADSNTPLLKSVRLAQNYQSLTSHNSS